MYRDRAPGFEDPLLGLAKRPCPPPPRWQGKSGRPSPPESHLRLGGRLLLGAARMPRPHPNPR